MSVIKDGPVAVCSMVITVRPTGRRGRWNKTSDDYYRIKELFEEYRMGFTRLGPNNKYPFITS